MSRSVGETTLRGTPLVQAPGKVFLIGEYAVLAGGTAVVAAVGRYAVGQYLPGAKPVSLVVAETQREARDRLVGFAEALPVGAVLVDTDQFQEGGVKLGLGSSAAVAAAVAGTLLESVGKPIGQRRDELFEIADAGHRAAQGGVGSGADVAAATYGGYLRFARVDGAQRPAIAALLPPPSLCIRVFRSTTAASTPDMIAQVNAFAAARPEAYGVLIDELTRGAAAFAAAFARGATADVIAAAREYGDVMAGLGESAGSEIVPAAFAAAARAAEDAGGAAKPSGAGGGDIGVAFFPSPDAAAAFAKALPRGLGLLDVHLGAPGAQRRGLSFDPGMFQNFKKD